MLFDKPKRKNNVFYGELMDGEEILWMGQPDKWRIFTSQDWFTIPMSLLWCAFISPFVLTGIDSGNLFVFLIPHVWAGVYLLFGRYIIKFLRKTHTYYAVTSHRILIVSGLFTHTLEAFSLRQAPISAKYVGWGGVGTIIFESPEPKSTWWNRRRTYGHSSAAMENIGHVAPGFYDIHEVDEVYRLIAQMAHHTPYQWVEKSKPAYLPR